MGEEGRWGQMMPQGWLRSFVARRAVCGPRWVYVATAAACMAVAWLSCHWKVAVCVHNIRGYWLRVMLVGGCVEVAWEPQRAAVFSGQGDAPLIRVVYEPSPWWWWPEQYLLNPLYNEARVPLYAIAALTVCAGLARRGLPRCDGSCPKCGYPRQPHGVVCTECGNRLEPRPTQSCER